MILRKISWFLILIGYGIALHAVASELYWKGGYEEILKPQGEWIGFALMLIGLIILYFIEAKHFRKKTNS